MTTYSTSYLGLDVHKETIVAAVAHDLAPAENLGTFPNTPEAARKLVTRVGANCRALRVAYEAGPTGYVLYRQLASMGIDCMVVAPSLTPVKPGDRVKTDQRDATNLARLLRSGDLTSVWVPDEGHEALRD